MFFSQSGIFWGTKCLHTPHPCNVLPAAQGERLRAERAAL